MPLASKTNNNTEPRKKRAKTQTKAAKEAAAIAVAVAAAKELAESNNHKEEEDEEEEEEEVANKTTSSTENDEPQQQIIKKQTNKKTAAKSNKNKDKEETIKNKNDLINNNDEKKQNQQQKTTNTKKENSLKNSNKNELKNELNKKNDNNNNNNNKKEDLITSAPNDTKLNSTLNNPDTSVSGFGAAIANSTVLNGANVSDDVMMTEISNSTTTTITTTTSLKAKTTTSALVAIAQATNDLTLNTTNGTANNNTTANITHLPELHDTINRGTTKPGLVLAVGENLSNQLGLGCEVDDRKKPQMVKELPKNIIQVAAGGMHSAVLTEDGIVYTFGCNDEYALGRDNEDEIDKVDLPEKSIEITTGDSHTAALSESGIVYAWGTFRDGSGVLGLENKKIAKIPMKFKLGKKITKISSGADHLVFLTSTGEVFTAGNSEHGQLGRISKYNSCRGGRRGCDMILEPGLVRFAKRKELQGHRQIEDIWTTSYCTFLKVKDSDLIIGFGLNNCYQLGVEDAENRYQPDLLQSLKFESKLIKVIGGMHHTLFLDSLGNVYSMGSHRYGCLGLGKIDVDLKKPQKIEGLKDIIDIAANTNVSYAIDKSGKVFNWGTNYSKQLGQDTEDDYFVPTLINSKQLDVRDCYTVSIGGQHSLFIVSEEKDQDDSM